jgi:cytochrome c-type biogenesis protein CcmE
VIALLLGWFLVTNTGGDVSFAYFQDLSSFQASEADQVGRATRVHGYVAKGSIERDLQAMQVQFRVQNDPPHAGGAVGQTLKVTFASLETPDLFKDGAEVVVEGVLLSAGPDGVYHADKVMAKCPSKFEAADITNAASL